MFKTLYYKDLCAQSFVINVCENIDVIQVWLTANLTIFLIVYTPSETNCYSECIFICLYSTDSGHFSLYKIEEKLNKLLTN